MMDGSDAVSDWPLLNALLNTASGATWVSLHHGGGVGMGYSQHSGVVIVADGTPEAAKRLERVLWNDPATGVMRHADAGYDIARDAARAGPQPALAGGAERDRHSLDRRRARCTLAQLRAVLDGPVTVALTPRPPGTVRSRPRPAIAAIVAEGRTVYGVNTGFGLLANTSIARGRSRDPAANLVLSHACGVGAAAARRGRAPDDGAEDRLACRAAPRASAARRSRR